jgi:hypothetical protein
MAAVAIWIVGLLGCGVLGAIVSNWIAFPNYGSGVSVWGFIVGALAFACVRVLVAALRKNSN